MPFDPNKPYTVISGEGAAPPPVFDPNKPYDVIRGEGRDTSRDSYEAQLEDLGITPQEQKEVEEIGRSAERYSDLWAAKEEAARKGEYWEGVANRAGQLSDWVFEPLTRPISGVIGRPVDALINLAYPGGGGGAPGDPGYVEQITGRSVIPPIPRAVNMTEEETQALGWSPMRSGATKVAGGVWNAAAGLLEGLSTPDMIAQLPAAGNKAVLSGWISSMAAHAPERVMAAAEKYRAGDTQGAVEEVASAVGELGLAELGRRHVMRGPGDISVADVDGPPRLQINQRGEVVDRASPDLIARNVAAPGTMRPQEMQTWGLPDIEAPAEMVRVPQVNQYGEPVPIYERVPIYNEYGEVVDVRMRARPRPPRRMAAPPIREMVMEEPSRIIQPELPRNVRESPEGGKVSFAAGAPVLNREAISYPKPPSTRSLFSEAEVEQVVRGSGFEPSEVRRLSRLSMEELEREWMAARDAHERALAEGKTLGELAGTGLDWRVGILQNLMERAFRLGERAPRPAPPEPEPARRLPPIREVVMEEPSRIIQPELPRNVRESPEGGKVSFAAEAPGLNREAISFGLPEELPPEPPTEPPTEPPGGGVPGGGGPRPPPAPGGLSIDLALAQEAARREGQRARRVAAPLIRDLALEEPPKGLTPPGNLPESQLTAPETITGPPAGRGEKEGKASVMPAEAGESPAPVRSIPEGGRPGRRRGTNRPPDIIDHILNTIGKIKSVSSSHKRDASLYEGWQDLRRFGAAREVLSPGGIAPDVALRSLIEDRYMPEGATIDDLRNAIIDAAKARRGDREATSEENRLIKVMERQHLDFVKSGINRRLPGVAVTDLFAGDKFKLNGVEVRVQDFEFDENGEVIAVILDDGRRYGTQRVGVEQIIRPDKGTLERTQDVGFAPEPPKPTEEVKQDAVQELGPGGVSEEPGAIGVSPVGGEVRPAEEGAKAPPTEGAAPAPVTGLVSGTGVEAWADQTIQRSKSLGVRPVDPLELFAAYVVKGAAIMERGTRRFTDWAPRMIAEYGDAIRPHLRRIYEQASTGLARTAGDNRELKQRKLAARGASSPEVAAPHRERMRTGAEAFYEPQDTGRAEDLVGKMTSDELGAVPVQSPDGPANLWTLAQLEMYRRNVAAGNMDAAWAVMENAMRTGTSLGQLINQFKMLKGATPHGVLAAINQRLRNVGYDPMRPSEQLRTRRLAEESIKANATWKESERAAIAAPTDANVNRAMAARKEAVAADVQLQKVIQAYQPRVFWDMLTTLLKGNLLAPISQTANIAGNTSNLAIRASDRSQRAVVDSIDSYLRNRPRQAAVAPVRGTIEAGKAIGRAVPDAVRSLWQGTSDAELNKADVQRGLQPLVALRNLFKRDVLGPQRNGKTPLGQRLLMALEASPFSMHATAQLRLLGAVDKLYKNPARARLIVEALRLRDANRPEGTPKLYTPGNAAEAVKYPEMFFDEATLERIDQEAAAAVYQQKNPVTKALNRAMANATPGARFAVATIAPYVTTPSNVIGEWMSYNPLVAGANTIRHGMKGNARAAETAAGKMVSGLMMLGAGAWLYNKGLISPSLEQPSEQQKARILEGMTMPPHHINLSGLKRAMAGGDPKWRKGDRSVDVLRAGGVAGAMMLSSTDVLRQRERQPKAGGVDLAARVLGDQWTQMLQYGVNQSFLKGTANLLNAIQEGKVDSWTAQYADTLSAIPFPGTLASASRAMRQYKPEVRGDSLDQRLENQLRSRLGVFGADNKLPFKRDLWGRPIKETPEGNLPWVYQMLDVSKAAKIPNDDVALMLYGLYRRTGKEAVIPTPPDANFSIGGREFDTLDREQLSRLQELVGQSRYRMAQRILLNERFLNQPLDAKLATLEKLWNAGAREGGAQFWRERGSQLKPKRGRAGFIQE